MIGANNQISCQKLILEPFPITHATPLEKVSIANRKPFHKNEQRNFLETSSERYLALKSVG